MAHLQPGEGVERAERLVHQQHRGTQHQRTRERDALAHAAGELLRIALRRLAGEAEPVEQLVRARGSAASAAGG